MTVRDPISFANHFVLAKDPTTGCVAVARRDIADLIGPTAWSVYRNLLMIRDRWGLVRLKITTFVRKLGEWWAKLKKPRSAPSARMVRHYLKRLAEVGLVEATGKRTSGGCAVRRVHGRKHVNPDCLLVPERTAECLARQEVVPYAKQRVSRVSGNHCLPVASHVSSREPRKDGDFRHAPTVELPSVGVRDERVGSAGDAGTTSFKERGDSGEPSRDVPISKRPWTPKPNKTPTPKPNPELRITMPTYPSEITGWYEPPPKPKIHKSDSNLCRVVKMLCAYRWAVHQHTGKPCAKFSRGCTRAQAIVLQRAAQVCLDHDLSPYVWAMYWLRYLEDTAREEGKAFKLPELVQLFAPSLIDRMRAPCRAAVSPHEGFTSWTPPLLEKLCEDWLYVQSNVRRWINGGEVTTQDQVDAYILQQFPTTQYQEQTDSIRREMQYRYSQDLAMMRKGRARV